MQTVTTVRVMRESDGETIRRGTPGLVLMRRAGEAIYACRSWRGKVSIVCGSGNNAGDGYVLAALLHQAGFSCELVRLGNEFSSDGAYYYGKCKEIGVSDRLFDEKTDFSDTAEIVDCIFGTGFHGEVEGVAAEAIRRINQSAAYVVSVDINSGLCGDNGKARLCVHSDLTVSIGFYQPGHFLGDAKDVIGDLINLDIGIGLFGASMQLAEASDFVDLFAGRLQNSHKGDYGYVGLLGGSTAYSGAVKLANLSCAALRAGAGVARLIVAGSLASAVAPYLLESTLCCLPDREGAMRFDPTELERAVSGLRSLAVGMGWGRAADNADILRYLLLNYRGRLVIDADGLNTLAELGPAVLEQAACRVLLTPHPKEMERLCGKSVQVILEDPIGISTEFAAKYHVSLLLKGPTTIVTDGNETILVDRGCAGMATAGSGDVLSGILAGLFGFCELTPHSAACGAYLAGLAGELAEREVGAVSMLASDTVAKLPSALARMLEAFD